MLRTTLRKLSLFFADAMRAGITRREAADVAAFARAMVEQRPAEPERSHVASDSPPVSESLHAIREALVMLATPVEPPRPEPSVQAPPPMPREDADDAELSPRIEIQRPPEPEGSVIPGAAGLAIDLCDWLERAHEDERIAPERGLAIAARKAATLLEMLGVERIDRTGQFDSRDQQIVECVSTDAAEIDMHVMTTVQCGYTWNGRLVRPQRVMVYRRTEA